MSKTRGFGKLVILNPEAQDHLEDWVCECGASALATKTNHVERDCVRPYCEKKMRRLSAAELEED